MKARIIKLLKDLQGEKCNVGIPCQMQVDIFTILTSVVSGGTGLRLGTHWLGCEMTIPLAGAVSGVFGCAVTSCWTSSDRQ